MTVGAILDLSSLFNDVKQSNSSPRCSDTNHNFPEFCYLFCCKLTNVESNESRLQFRFSAHQWSSVLAKPLNFPELNVYNKTFILFIYSTTFKTKHLHLYTHTEQVHRIFILKCFFMFITNFLVKPCRQFSLSLVIFLRNFP